MNNSLKKEIALLAGLWTLLGARSRAPMTTALLTAGTTALYLSSLRKDFDLRGRNVLVTGGSRGLGLSLAWNLLERGAAGLTLVARDQGELDKARAILIAQFPNARVWTTACDVTDGNALATMLDQAVKKMGSIDLLVNNAGSILVGPFSSMDREDFEAQMKLHLYAVIEATQLIFAHFKTRGGGRILNICSLGGKVAVPHMLPYDASKFALAGFSQGVAAELAAHGIVVTTAYPTVMRTGSPIQAVFKGNHEKEFEWFGAIDNLPGLSMSADKAAKKILDAVEDGRTEVILSLPAKARMFFGAIFPETMHALMGLVARILPSEDSTVRKTGAQSSGRFASNPLLAPLKRKAREAETTYNQEARHDADFNMGLLH